MNETEAKITSRVLVFGGLPVCGALVTAFTWLAIRALTGGPPLETMDWIAGAIFVGLSALGLLVALRASRRIWQRGTTVTDKAPLLARISPVLVVVGLVAGVPVGHAIQTSSETSLENGIGYFWCGEPALLGFADVEACKAAGVPCLREGWVNAAPWQAKADELAKALEARRAALMAAPEYDSHAVGEVDTLLRELAVRSGTEKRSAARRAGVACLSAAASKPAR